MGDGISIDNGEKKNKIAEHSFEILIPPEAVAWLHLLFRFGI